MSKQKESNSVPDTAEYLNIAPNVPFRIKVEQEDGTFFMDHQDLETGEDHDHPTHNPFTIKEEAAYSSDKPGSSGPGPNSQPREIPFHLKDEPAYCMDQGDSESHQNISVRTGLRNAPVAAVQAEKELLRRKCTSPAGGTKGRVLNSPLNPSARTSSHGMQCHSARKEAGQKPGQDKESEKVAIRMDQEWLNFDGMPPFNEPKCPLHASPPLDLLADDVFRPIHPTPPRTPLPQFGEISSSSELVDDQNKLIEIEALQLKEQMITKELILRRNRLMFRRYKLANERFQFEQRRHKAKMASAKCLRLSLQSVASAVRALISATAMHNSLDRAQNAPFISSEHNENVPHDVEGGTGNVSNVVTAKLTPNKRLGN